MGIESDIEDLAERVAFVHAVVIKTMLPGMVVSWDWSFQNGKHVEPGTGPVQSVGEMTDDWKATPVVVRTGNGDQFTVTLGDLRLS